MTVPFAGNTVMSAQPAQFPPDGGQKQLDSARPQLDGGKLRLADSYVCIATPSCLRLLAQELRRAASRAACTAGSKSPTSVPMIAITTNNSTSVKAARCGRLACLKPMIAPPEKTRNAIDHTARPTAAAPSRLGTLARG